MFWSKKKSLSVNQKNYKFFYNLSWQQISAPGPFFFVDFNQWLGFHGILPGSNALGRTFVLSLFEASHKPSFVVNTYNAGIGAFSPVQEIHYQANSNSFYNMETPVYFRSLRVSCSSLTNIALNLILSYPSIDDLD